MDDQNVDVPTVAIQAEPPRSMTREDRRIVYNEIEGVYDTSGLCYRERWSDESVAKALNVPRAWVTAIRDEFFGPEIDEATAKRRAEIEAILHQNEAIAKRIGVMEAELRELWKRSQETAESIKKILAA